MAAALAYELAKTGFSVLLLEQDQIAANATRYSYGGIPYWSGKTPLTQQLCQEAIARYQILPQELDADLQFRELDLLITIAEDTEPHLAAASYSHVNIPPQPLTIQEACELEPLLNQNAISGALTIKHGQVHPEKMLQAYIQAFLRLGGEIQFTQVLELTQILTGEKGFSGVKTNHQNFSSGNIAICAVGMSRQLLKLADIAIKIYFSHAELIETPLFD